MFNIVKQKTPKKTKLGTKRTQKTMKTTKIKYNISRSGKN